MIEREFSLPSGPESRPAAAPPPRRSAAKGKRYGRTGRQRRRRVVFRPVARLVAIVGLLGAAAEFGIRWAIELLGRAAVAFERLPLVQDEALLRNILYSGLWQGYDDCLRRRAQKKNKQDKESEVDGHGE